MLRVLIAGVVLYVAMGCFSQTVMAKPPVAELGWSKTEPASGPFVKTDRGYMVPYKTTLPGSDLEFEMIPVPGGMFMMGSPDSEADRESTEGPQFEVQMEPFWIGKYEVTWAEYHQFMALYKSFKKMEALRLLLSPESAADPRQEEQHKKLKMLLGKHQTLKTHVANQVEPADAITAPTELYEPSITYQYGDEPRQPAVTMTQYAAKHYTKWLSKATGQYYRLPTDVEWEYACRAGTKTAYPFGDDPALLGEYAWFADNSEGELQKVGTKKPNPWGIHDMLGSVGEWVLDAQAEDGFARFNGQQPKASEAVIWPTEVSPRVVRGGHWDAEAKACRSASRWSSDDETWKEEDPNIPLSPWWFTSEPAHSVGFRVVRPLNTPSQDELNKVWEADVDDIRFDVEDRLSEGRGVLGQVDPKLPEALEQLEAVSKELGLQSE